MSGGEEMKARGIKRGRGGGRIPGAEGRRDESGELWRHSRTVEGR